MDVESKEAVVMFSSKVTKFYKYTKQERHLIITNLNIYVFNKKKLMRVVPIEGLAGLTKLLRPDS